MAVTREIKAAREEYRAKNATSQRNWRNSDGNKEVTLTWSLGSELTFLSRALKNPEGYPISLKFFCPICGEIWASCGVSGYSKWHAQTRACPEHGWASLQLHQEKEYPLPPELMERELKIATTVGLEKYEWLKYGEGLK